jgi:hypothetical protein
MKSFLQRPKRKSSPEVLPEDEDEDDNEPTEVKLALLSSLHSNIDQETLLDVLLAHEGSVKQASASLQGGATRKAATSHSTSQQSLRKYAISDNQSPPAAKRPKTRKGTTLHLYDPDDVAEHTPCTIIHNFLPSDLANDLLKELLEESKSFEKITFKLFENVVASPHTSSFYVESYDEIQAQKTDYHYNGAKLTVSAQTDRKSVVGHF